MRTGAPTSGTFLSSRYARRLYTERALVLFLADHSLLICNIGSDKGIGTCSYGRVADVCTKSSGSVGFDFVRRRLPGLKCFPVPTPNRGVSTASKSLRDGGYYGNHPSKDTLDPLAKLTETQGT